MIVKREYRKYVPVQITLETEQELEGLFHLANCDPDIALTDYLVEGTPRRRVRTRVTKRLLHMMLDRFFYDRR